MTLPEDKPDTADLSHKLGSLALAAGLKLNVYARAQRFLRQCAPHHRDREWYKLIEELTTGKSAAALPECGTRNAAGAAAAGSENVAPSGVLPVDVAPAAPAEGPTPSVDVLYDQLSTMEPRRALLKMYDHARQLQRELGEARAEYKRLQDAHAECVVAMVPFIPAFGYLRDAIKELGQRASTVSATPLFVPNEAMLNAARDWSHEKFGKPIGNDAATGCWQAMYTALYRATPVSAKQERK